LRFVPEPAELAAAAGGEWALDMEWRGTMVETFLAIIRTLRHERDAMKTQLEIAIQKANTAAEQLESTAAERDRLRLEVKRLEGFYQTALANARFEITPAGEAARKAHTTEQKEEHAA
jgi:hypothetical protein